VADPGNEAYDAALAALRRREWATAELAGWLVERGHDAVEVERAIARLSGAGELDDARFAQRYSEDKRELRGWGAERIREALAARGVAAELIEAALVSDSEAAQVDRASRLLARRPLVTDADRARALGYLTRRGYRYEVAHEAIREATRGAALRGSDEQAFAPP
jgi:regulatory protein